MAQTLSAILPQRPFADDPVVLTDVPDDARAAFRVLFEEHLTDELEPALRDLGLTHAELLELPERVGELSAARLGTEVVGFVWIEVRELVLHVHGLVLRPECRGRGLGARLLRALEEEFRGIVDELELGVHDANEGARALYLRCGFRDVERRPEIGFSIMRKRVEPDDMKEKER